MTSPIMFHMDVDAYAHLLRWKQSGVVSRRQIIELGGSDSDIARMLRRRELSRVRRGVYLNHTGGPTDEQLAWVAVLAYWPAALSHDSAVPRPRFRPTVHVAIDQDRTVPTLRGITVHRTADFAERVDWTASPPAIRPAHAVIDAMVAATDVVEMYRILTDAAHSRIVWPALLRDSLHERRRVPRRRLLTEMINDLEDGNNSVLERGFARLEKAHGLPGGTRQFRVVVDGKVAYRDVRYAEQKVVIELDGRAFHEGARARDIDARRDLDAVVAGDLPLRLTYGQVFRDGCNTANRIAVILRSRGWTGTPRRCPTCT